MRHTRQPRPLVRLAVGVLFVVLVAPPCSDLVLCRGADGHVAVESRSQSSCCLARALVAGDEASTSTVGQCSGCLDTDIFPVAAAAERYPTVQFSPGVSAIPPEAAAAPAASTTVAAVPAAMLTTSQVRRALRAVVLLI